MTDDLIQEKGAENSEAAEAAQTAIMQVLAQEGIDTQDSDVVAMVLDFGNLIASSVAQIMSIAEDAGVVPSTSRRLKFALGNKFVLIGSLIEVAEGETTWAKSW